MRTRVRLLDDDDDDDDSVAAETRTAGRQRRYLKQRDDVDPRVDADLATPYGSRVVSRTRAPIANPPRAPPRPRLIPFPVDGLPRRPRALSTSYRFIASRARASVS